MRRRISLILALFILITLFWITGGTELFVVRESGTIEVVMCPQCKERFLAEVQAGGLVVCALYDFGNETAEVLRAVNASVIIDQDAGAPFGKPIIMSGLMHNKFCVINDTTVLTGSYNPTDGGERNRNNLVIVHSKSLAHNYRAEYAAIHDRASRNGIKHTLYLNGTRIENYFCPKDGCEQYVREALGRAQHEVLFMTYSFTSNGIGSDLAQLQKNGVQVEGVCDGRQERSEKTSSECPALGAKVWENKTLLHHKVFIIDRTTVITGSYNPTASGDKRNRENILIIHDPAIATQYITEYEAINASAVETKVEP